MKSPLRYIVITRPRVESRKFAKQLQDLGFKILFYPSIQIVNNRLSKRAEKSLTRLALFDCVLFTSRNGVRFFMDALRKLKIDSTLLHSKQIGAVGSKTAEAVKMYNLPVHFTPSQFTTENLAKEMPGVKGKRILLPRSNIANTILKKQLETKGAVVTNIPIYKTEFLAKPNSRFTALLKDNQIYGITFTSPSTVRGFIKSLIHTKQLEKVLSIPVLSIGPVTTKEAKQYGFQSVYTAGIHTTEGMVSKLQQSIL